MALSSRPEDYEYDVFLLHSTLDEDYARELHRALTENVYHPFKVAAQFDGQSFPPGKPVHVSICKLIKGSYRSVLLVTKNSVNSPWINLETIHALEESKYRNNELVLRLILINVREDEVPALKKGCLEKLPHFILNLAEEGWETKLKLSLQEPLEIRDILPVGSLAHGLVFSHFIGFISYLIKRMEERIQESDAYMQYPEKCCMKYIMILPKSCHMTRPLEGRDDKSGIEIKKELPITFREKHIGKDRLFSMTVYRITKGEDFYFFFGDMPNVLNCIYTLESLKLAEGVDSNLQIQRFKHTVNNIVHHTKFWTSGTNPLQIVEYNDQETDCFEELFRIVQDDVKSENDTTAALQCHPVDDPVVGNVERDVFVGCSADQVDRDIAARIVYHLQSCNVSVHFHEANKGMFVFPKCKWYVFVLSKAALLDKPFTYQINMMVSHSVEVDQALVIPVLHEVDVRLVPDFIRWITMLSTNEPDLCEHIYLTIKGVPVKMIEKMPAGDVVTGLCWAYLINYLKRVLFERTPMDKGNLDFRGRIQKFLREKKLTCGCVEKMFILWPRSCATEGTIVEMANKGLVENEARVKMIASLPPVFQKDRPFYLSVFNYTNQKTNRNLCFIAEYCTPMGCLHEMATKYQFAGINAEDAAEQGDRFAAAFEKITAQKAVKEKFGDFPKYTKFLSYDDCRKSLLEMLEDQIVQENDLVYA